MKEPKRLVKDHPDSLGALLLRGGREDVPDRKRVEHIVSGLLGVGGTLVSGTAGATVLSTWNVAQWFALGALGGVVATSALFILERPARPVAAPAPAVSVADVAPVATATPLRGGALLSSSAARVEPSAASEPARRQVSRFTPAPSSTSTLPPQSTLGAEAATLAAAKAALDRHMPADALATLRAYRARFPRGELGQDASYLEMEAELARGNRAAAQGIAAALANGSTPSAERAREVLKGAQP